jgi:hypothetical protein
MTVVVEDGPLKGVAFQYDTVSFAEQENEDGSLTLSFNTIELENKEKIDLSLDTSKDIMGDILVDIIKKNLEEQPDDNREPDT